ncbi:hypothetical protein ZWY2020_036690 [Hordeum vulgare]|nr:hypothetical protein ZWY2020_036690 [Hordeum vulgare]
MSSLAVGYGLELELELGIWFAGLFSAPELAAADLLLQLSVLGEAEARKSSRSSASSCCEGLPVEVEGRCVEDTAASTEPDGRARKRYRPVSELYSDTIPLTSAAAAVKKKRRKRHHDRNGSWSSSEATRYGGDY